MSTVDASEILLYHELMLKLPLWRQPDLSQIQLSLLAMGGSLLGEAQNALQFIVGAIVFTTWAERRRKAAEQGKLRSGEVPQKLCSAKSYRQFRLSFQSCYQFCL